jgi:hypothetical protein
MDLRVQENGKPLTYSFDDIMRYHGFAAPGGVGQAFKVLERALPLLDGGALVERREVSVRTPFGGPGVRDAFEMVTRAITEDRFTVDREMANPRGGLATSFIFTLTYRGASVTVALRDGFVAPEFAELGRKSDRTQSEQQRFNVLKQEMADKLLATPADEVYDVL